MADFVLEEVNNIFKNILSQLVEIDRGLLEECFEKFDFFNYKVGFYDTYITINDKFMGDNVDVIGDFRKTVNQVIDERFAKLKILYLKSTITYEMFSKINKPESDPLYKMYNNIIDIISNKRKNLLEFKEMCKDKKIKES